MTPQLKQPLKYPSQAVSGARPWALGAGVEAAGTPALAGSTLSCHAATPQLFCSKAGQVGRASGGQRKAQRPKYQRSRVNIRRGKTDLKAGLPRGLQGMLQGLAEEIVGDGRP